MEKDTRNVTAVAAISFILGMLIAFMAVLVAVAVTKPCGGYGYMGMPAPHYRAFDKKQLGNRMHRMEQREVKRAVPQRPILIVETMPEDLEEVVPAEAKAETK